MNFFKSVFSSDPDPSDSSSEGKSPSVSPHKPQDIEGEEDGEYDPNPNDNHTPKPTTPWVGLGTLIKTFASKSESVIHTYRRDLEEFGSGLKKETEAIREVASRAVRVLPSSLEAGASAAQESLESVGQAIDDFGVSVWRGTAEIYSGGAAASSSKRHTRFELQVLAMQSDINTFSEEPEEDGDFRKWMSEFQLEEKEEEIELLCYDNGTMESLFEKLVPSAMDYHTFWTRYFYKLDKLKHAEDVRANLVKRVISREDADEDLSWDVEDEEEEEEGNQAKNEHIREEDESNVEIKVERKEEGDENKEESNCEHVEAINERGDAQEKEPGGEPEDSRIDVTTTVDNEIAPGAVDDGLPESSPVAVESFKERDSVIEEEDLGWDEIEDVGEHDDKKAGDEEGLHKRLNVAEDDVDLTWDIEDDD